MLAVGALTLLATSQALFNLDHVVWGATREQLSATVPSFALDSNSKLTSDGLVYGGRRTISSEGLMLEMKFFFTPLSGQLAEVAIEPTANICRPLLAELRLKFGEGVDVKTVPEIENWQFSDTRMNTRWNFYIINFPRPSSSCSIIGHPLAGT
jgi:hypothetical protein